MKFCSVAFLTTLFLFAQSKSRIDSLNTLVRSGIPDTQKVYVFLELAGETYLSSPATAEKYCNDALVLSEKINFDNGLANSLGWLAYLNEQKGDIETALAYYNRSLVLAYKLNNKKDQASVLNNIAAIYKDRGKIDSALLLHDKSLALRIATGDKGGIATSYNNIGLIRFNQGRILEALDYYMKALRTYEEIKDKDGIATTLINVASVYKDQKEYEQAFAYYRKSLAIRHEMNDIYGIGYSLNGLGGLFEQTGNDDSALYYFKQALDIRQGIDDKQGVAYSSKNIGLIYDKRKNYTQARKFYEQSLAAFRQIKDKWGIASATNRLGEILLHTGNNSEAEKYFAQSFQLAKELGFPSDIQNAAGNLQKVYRSKAEWKKALEMYDLFLQMHDSVLNDNNRKASLQTQFRYEYEKKEIALKSEQEIKDARSKAEIAKQKIIRNSFIAGFAVMLVFAIVFLAQRLRIAKEKKRSDELLLNILPEETARELKEKGYADARQFDEITVLFTDFKGFTTVAEKLSPHDLVKEINECFSAFDRICEKYKIEKIKTIGDAYMAASGLPSSNPHHATDMVKAAIEIRDFMTNKQFQIRIGLHSGPVVAGIVGIKKFQYDIWGDTVNTASRMESSGEPGKVNISEATYELVKDKFKTEYRGEIEAKNKGKLKMYFVS